MRQGRGSCRVGLAFPAKKTFSCRPQGREREAFSKSRSQEMLIILYIKAPPVLSGLTQGRTIYFSAMLV